MLNAIMENAGTILVSLLLLGAVTGVIVKLYRDKKKGKSSCGCNCGCCPMAGACHKQS
ncbi:MAG: FeoB-associated Cys-rich membrane protein [Clostridia bacterium]|nr:FeoB-associated Cys-rich membrane protein [Clostridia bacterium]